jgi:putative ABC transport system ATP-binding protein
VLELRAVEKQYVSGDQRIVAVADVSLRVSPGELVALYGPSGSGKSTLLLLAAAVLRPDAGEVLFGERSLSSLSSSEAADYRLRDLGFIRQSLDLIPGATALDNAALKLLGDYSVGEAHRKVEPLLDRFGLGDRIGQHSEHLSMGERQRVLIARALANEPRLVLADEPTGNLDSERGREVLALLRELCKERSLAVLLVTHDPEAATFADRTLALRDGRLDERRDG